MSCYLRHIEHILNESGITVAAGKSGQIDYAIHKIVGTHYKDCPGTWQRVKQQVILDEQQRQEFIGKLKDAIE